MKTEKIIVTDDFVEIFQNFNVFSQINKMKKLSRRELYLLLVACLDKHDDTIEIVNLNFSAFKKEIIRIYNIQDDKNPSNQTLRKLSKETGDKYIETANIVSQYGKPLPKPYSKTEIRDVKINYINSLSNPD
jgi:hypothetical protein